nr:hypothetical protein [Pseudomonas koreensis]
MQSLKNLSQLLVTFMTTLDRSTDESQALSFPVRTYTVKNLVEVLPTITSIKESPGGEEIPHGSPTVKTAVTLSGTATPDTKIDLANNGVLMPNTEIEVDSKGEWTSTLTALIAGTTYSLSARRKDGTLSNTWNIVVVASVVPTLDNVLDDRNVEVLEGTITVSTDLILKGTASPGQKVEIFDGNGASAVSKGVATAHATTGIWEHSITVALGARRLYAKALYAVNPVFSDVRNLTVTAATAPTLTSVKGSPSGVEITQGGSTVETAVTLSGIAAKGQKVDVLDGTTSKGQPAADPVTGVWICTVIDLVLGPHSFTAKAMYGGGEQSPARNLTIVKILDDFTDFTDSNWNDWKNVHDTYGVIDIQAGNHYWKNNGGSGYLGYTVGIKKIFRNLEKGKEYEISCAYKFGTGGRYTYLNIRANDAFVKQIHIPPTDWAIYSAKYIHTPVVEEDVTISITAFHSLTGSAILPLSLDNVRVKML